MHTAVSRTVVALTGLLLVTGGLVAAGPAVADPSRSRPAEAAAAVAGGYTALSAPARLYDSRPAGLVAGGTKVFSVVGTGGVPAANVAAVVLNTTAFSPTRTGNLTIFPGGAKPVATTLNYTAGRTVANLAVVAVGANGTVTLANAGPATLAVVVDVVGWYSVPPDSSAPDGSFEPVAPVRIADTGSAGIAAGASRTFPVIGKGGVGTSAGAVFLNVTAVPGAAAGTITAYPGPTSAKPTASTVNFLAGQTTGTMAAVRIAADGTITVTNSSKATVRVILDLQGWFHGSSTRTAGLTSLQGPTRVFSTTTGIGGPKSPLAPGATRVVTVGGQAGVPSAGVSAVLLDTIATNAAATGSLTVWSGATRPNYASLNYAAGLAVPDLTVVPLVGGQVSFFNNGTKPVDVLADVVGYVRSTDLGGSVSHYVRSLTAAQTTTQITTATTKLGQADAGAATAGTPQVVLLQFGAQSNKAGGNGSGTGTGANQDGVRLSATNMRLTYPQVVAAVNGYVDGYVAGRGSNRDPVTVVVGTSTAGFLGATYSPEDKAADWWGEVVEPAVEGASGTGITVVGGTDIEANFDATYQNVQDWITTYLRAAPSAQYLVNNGAASGCPTTIGATTDCVAVPVEDNPGLTQKFSLAQVYAVSGGLSPTRIKVLPQIYLPSQANQWENVDLKGTAAGGAKLSFLGALSSYDACSGPNSGCTSVVPDQAVQLLTAALNARSGTATTVTVGTDLTIS